MKDKLYRLLKAQLRDHIFSLILACSAPVIFYFLLFDDGSAYPPLVYMTAALCIFAIFYTLKELSRSAKDYFLYMRNQTCEEITGKVVSIYKERGKNGREYPVVRGEKTGAELILKISNVKDVILNRMYPYCDDAEYSVMDVPDRFAWKQVRIAAYFMNKRGAEGETQHIENGIHRNYKSSDVPEDMLWDVFPMVGIPG